MRTRYLYSLLIFFSVFSFLGIHTSAGIGLDTSFNSAIPSDDFEIQYELAQDLYHTSGLVSYFEQRSMLWTENMKRRNDLLSKLPPISATKIKQFQAQVFHLLEINPNDPMSLLLAGDYHYYCHQKQTAFWYYQQAYKLMPQSEAVNLALADYYLYEWQPEKVQELLSGLKSPAVSLRKGAAYLQSGEYTLAFGYLTQANPLPSGWQITRDKDLYKADLALGEIKQIGTLVKATYLQSPFSGTIFWELLGWSAWLTGNHTAALNNWQSGKAINTDYKFWESNIEWLHPDTHISFANNTKDFHDSDLDAAFEIAHGQMLIKEGQWDLAYKEYLSSIHHDHRSLIGFLGACTVQLLKRDYSEALDLCNQGLAVNHDFGPLLTKRAEAFEKLGRFNEATNDRTHAVTVKKVSNEDAILQLRLIENADERGIILVQGKMKDLVGFWVSEDGENWKWYPWWGGPIPVGNGLHKAWVIPCGPGLSGEAFYLEQVLPPIIQADSNALRVQDQQVLIQLQFPAKLVLEFTDQQKQKTYVVDEMTMEHRIPLSVFPDGKTELQICWQNETGFWGTFNNSLDLPVLLPKEPSQYLINTDTLITNHRRIGFNLASVGGSTDDVWVSLGETDIMEEWLPFQPVIYYTLSAGDGPKTIIGRFKDRSGNIQEVKLDIKLDTSAPTLTLLEKVAVPQVLQLRWSANEAVSCWLRILNNEGKWQVVPALADSNNIYSGNVPVQEAVYCQIIAKDNAGNVRIISDETLNNQLRQAASVIFNVNDHAPDGANKSSSRWITLKPNVANVNWAVSNDQLTWSAWQQGDAGLTWRINPGDGEQLIFIKYQMTDIALPQYQVVTVSIDPSIGN
jgi:hypothetical protein